MRLSVVPSIFYVVLHLFFSLVIDNPAFYNGFIQESDAWTQVAFTVLIMVHCVVRQLSFYCVRNQHREKVVNDMDLRGNETMLDVKCNKGFWTCGVAYKLKSGGRILAMDQWDTPDTPFDGQWAVENSRREEVSGRVEVMNYGDPHYLVYKDDVFDATLCTWLETEDEIGFYNLCSEMVRVTRPGGRLIFVMPFHPPSLLVENLKDLGLSDVHKKLISTAYLINEVITATKPEEMTEPPHRIDRSENAVTDESPGFAGNTLLIFLGILGFYFNAVYTVCVYYTWETWEKTPDTSLGDTMAYGFMVENTVWLCWAIVDIHHLLSARPVYVVRRIGVVNLWIGYFFQFLIMVLVFNVVTWAPLMLISVTTGVSSVAIRAIFRVLCRPVLGALLDSFFQHKRQWLFLSTWKRDYGDKRNRYRKPRKSKRRKRETDLLLDELEGPEPEDAYAPGL